LVQAAQRPEYRDIIDATCGIAFLGTPHQGSSASAIGAFIAWLTTPFFGSNKMLLKSLQWHTAELSNLHENFHNMIKSQEKEIKIFSFYETGNTLLFNILPVGLVSFHSFFFSFLQLISARLLKGTLRQWT
jgi:hypothetical protein